MTVHFHHIHKRSAEAERLERLLKRIDNRWHVVFREFIDSTTDDRFIRQVADLLESGRVDAAVDLIDSFVVRMAASAIPPAFALVGSSQIERLREQISRLRPEVGVSFDPTHPAAVALQQKQQFDFIADFSVKQKEVVRQALSEAFQTGQGPLQAARSYRDAIGLTPKQWDAVANYRRLLEEGSLEALTRDIRDRRYDPTVERLFENGEPLTADQINTMVERYRQRYHQYRADVIARTESGRTLSEANREGMRQTAEMIQLPEERIKREWIHTADHRTRGSHANMQVSTVYGLEAKYVTGLGNHLRYPSDPDAPAEDTIQCRCVEVMEIIDVD